MTDLFAAYTHHSGRGPDLLHREASFGFQKLQSNSSPFEDQGKAIFLRLFTSSEHQSRYGPSAPDLLARAVVIRMD